jgi:hypothetical protein
MTLTGSFTCRHIRAGQMRLAVYHGPNRRQLASKFWKTDIVLTTYETLRSDLATTGPLYSGTWRRVVLDEGKYQCMTYRLSTSSQDFSTSYSQQIVASIRGSLETRLEKPLVPNRHPNTQLP